MSLKTCVIAVIQHGLFVFVGVQGEKADYYLRGSFIPQKTALLCLIRHQVLIQNSLIKNNKIVDDSEATIWIGAKRFEYDKKNDFGKILLISPCHLVYDDGIQKKYLPYYQSYINGIKKLGDHYFLPNYDPKEHYPTNWKEIKNNTSLNESDCYEEVERVGVDKNYSGKTENDSFFKQIWLKMKKGYSFGFYLTITDDVVLNDADVTFGKESSPFLMKVYNIPAESIQNANEPNAIVLISDAFVSQNFLTYSNFTVCDTVPFRNIINPTSGIHNYYGVHKSSVRLQLDRKSTRLNSSHG